MPYETKCNTGNTVPYFAALHTGYDFLSAPYGLRVTRLFPPRFVTIGKCVQKRLNVVNFLVSELRALLRAALIGRCVYINIDVMLGRQIVEFFACGKPSCRIGIACGVERHSVAQIIEESVMHVRRSDCDVAQRRRFEQAAGCGVCY